MRLFRCTIIRCNYDPIHNVEDGSRTYADSGYDCNGVCLADADGDGVCDAFEVLGCTDPNGCNYNSDATDSDLFHHHNLI